MTLYRFRPFNKHTDDELKNSYLYFSPYNELNDPMEGYFKLVFSGDNTMWENLFRHYLMCLVKSGFSKKKLESFVDTTIDDDFIQYNRNLFEEFTTVYGEIVNKIINREIPILKNELYIYLRYFYVVMKKVYSDKELIKKNKKDYDKLKESILGLLNTIGNIQQKNESEAIKILEEYYQKKPYKEDYVFPDKYLKYIVNLMYPKAYITCFSEAFENASMWAHYADKHRGICLMFDIGDKDKRIELYHNNNYASYPIQEIKYNNKFATIDFFKTAMLPCRDSKDKPDASEKYWSNFYNKTKDWEYEKEHRIVAKDTFESELKVEDRKVKGIKLKYKFENLSGIIFGMNVNMRDKNKIIELIQKKCKNEKRGDFKFFQAYYSDSNNKIESIEITRILKFRM